MTFLYNMTACTVVCSCGKECRLVWAIKTFVAQEDGWVFDPVRGWNCGAEGHRQSEVKNELRVFGGEVYG